MEKSKVEELWELSFCLSCGKHFKNSNSQQKRQQHHRSEERETLFLQRYKYLQVLRQSTYASELYSESFSNPPCSVYGLVCKIFRSSPYRECRFSLLIYISLVIRTLPTAVLFDKAVGIMFLDLRAALETRVCQIFTSNTPYTSNNFYNLLVFEHHGRRTRSFLTISNEVRKILKFTIKCIREDE